MLVIEICAVICVILLFAILNRLVEACALLGEIKKLITNPKIILPDEVIRHIIEMRNGDKAKS